MIIKWSYTDRNFRQGKFKDRYDKPCSILKSGLAMENCIWLGRDKPTGVQMHLTQEDAAELAKILIYFAGTGELPEQVLEKTPQRNKQ